MVQCLFTILCSGGLVKDAPNSHSLNTICNYSVFSFQFNIYFASQPVYILENSEMFLIQAAGIRVYRSSFKLHI